MRHITIATIQERLGFLITAKFIEDELKVAPDHRVKKSFFWTEDQYDQICDHLVAHVDEVARGRRDTVAPRTKPVEATPAPAVSDEQELDDFGLPVDGNNDFF
jgi:hypothetical protein